ncbi:MAG: endopeptidase La [Candidatus Krumholzibacteria bacterium]|nr:endopeptidase La [Candidatus Krumholzibacteria bacterium]
MTEAREWLECEVPSILPLLLLKSTVLFPLRVVSAQLATKPNLRLLDEYPNTDEIVGVGLFLDPDGPYRQSNLCSTAVACKVLSRTKMGQDTTQVVLQGLRRVRLTKILASRPYFKSRVECTSEPRDDSSLVRALIAQVIELVKVLVKIDERYTEELIKVVQLNVENGSRCADLVADMVPFGYVERRQVIETIDVSERLALLAELLKREIARTRVAVEVQAKTELSIDRTQREAFLREQLRIIRNELAELDPAESEIAELAARVATDSLPLAVAEEARRQVQRLHNAEIRAREGSTIRAYIEWILSMPWKATGKDRYDLRRARRILDHRYFALGNATDRLLEFLAVRKLGGDSGKPLLGITGPPGTGRTSLASTVAHILGRPLIRVAMNGIHDEAEILGQPRTDPAAAPGRILDGLRQAGVRNPVILIDEIDRLEPGIGDPLLAILEALDPARSCRFYDYYLGVPFDLSDVLFIITANVEDDIPEALWDVLHVIELPGYTEGVKMAIARERVWPQVVKEHGLTDRDTRLTNAALRTIIRRYTREAGVRELKTRLETICRRIAVKKASGATRRLSVNTKNLVKYLGKSIFPEGHVAREPQVGAATGLAWTETGGNLLPIEALIMPGEGKTLLTGLLGEVMQESVKAAYSYVRSRADELGIPTDSLIKKDLHVHFPEGAIPKDGPSAGIAVATTIASLLSGRPVRHDIAMTGEISLRGWVLPVGGIREKVLAAYRAGIRHVVLPRGNESDLTDVPGDVLGKMHPHFVEEVAEVFDIALVKKSKTTSRRR